MLTERWRRGLDHTQAERSRTGLCSWLCVKSEETSEEEGKQTEGTCNTDEFVVEQVLVGGEYGLLCFGYYQGLRQIMRLSRICLSRLGSKYSASCSASHLVLPRWCHTFPKRLTGAGELVFYLRAISRSTIVLLGLHSSRDPGL